jgi:drug/metabolite transporter (DMT)-like permease
MGSDVKSMGIFLVKRVWQSLYAALFVASLLSGAGAFGTKDLSHTNIDWYFVVASFVGGLIFPFLAIWQSRWKNLTPVPGPSFTRGPRASWRGDPFQWLRICNLSMCGGFVGALLGLQRATGQNAMYIFWIGSLALGFVAGDLIVRRVFRNDIN